MLNIKLDLDQGAEKISERIMQVIGKRIVYISYAVHVNDLKRMTVSLSENIEEYELTQIRKSIG